MKTIEVVAKKAVEGILFEKGNLSTNGKEIFSYRDKIAEKTGFDSWNVLPAGGISATTSKHCNGIAKELKIRGFKVTRS